MYGASSARKVSTSEFADAVIERLGERPQTLAEAHYTDTEVSVTVRPTPRAEKALVGVDVFLDWDEDGRQPGTLGARLDALGGDGLRLKLITNRGVKVYPDGLPETFWTDHWRCRYVATGDAVTPAQVVALQGRLVDAGLDVIKTENLYTFDGERAYSLAQGE